MKNYSFEEAFADAGSYVGNILTGASLGFLTLVWVGYNKPEHKKEIVGGAVVLLILALIVLLSSEYFRSTVKEVTEPTTK